MFIINYEKYNHSYITVDKNVMISLRLKDDFHELLISKNENHIWFKKYYRKLELYLDLLEFFGKENDPEFKAKIILKAL
jgi:hypothetical protein